MVDHVDDKKKNGHGNGEARRRRGRPRGGHSATIPWAEIETAFVHGVIVDRDPDDDSLEVPERKWLTYKQLGERFGCSGSIIHRRAQRFMWDERRAKFQERFTDQLDAELAKDLATSTAEQVAILDRFTHLFSRNLRNNGVRADNIGDLDKALRLREFLLGHADARSETSATVTLDTMQARHKAARERAGELDPVEAGIVVEVEGTDETRALAAHVEGDDERNDEHDDESAPAPSTTIAQAKREGPPPVADSCETRQRYLDVARKDSNERPPFDPLERNPSCRVANETASTSLDGPPLDVLDAATGTS